MENDRTTLKKNMKPVNAEGRSTYPNYSFPFKSVLSLHLLIEFWESAARGEQKIPAEFANRVLEELAKVPELTGPIEDLAVIEKNRPLVDAMMIAVFPPASWETDFAAAFLPYSFRSFYSTPGFPIEQFTPEGFAGRLNIDPHTMHMSKMINACAQILKRFYYMDVTSVYPVVATLPDLKTGLDRHYKITIDPRFVEIRNVGTLKPLKEEEKKSLVSNFTDLAVWLQAIPPENFEFHGFVLVKAIDVTEQEVLSALKYDLIERDAMISPARFESLQEKVRILVGQPSVLLGLAALPKDWDQFPDYGRAIGSSIALNNNCTLECSDFAGSAYERAFEDGQIIIVDDLATLENRSPIEEQILNQGIRNLVLCVLKDQSDTVGVLELGSPIPGAVNALNVMKLKEVLSLFTMAIKRGSDELNNSIQAIIKEKCTAIHPTVEWRFRKAALKLLNADDATKEMEPIVFEEVYPLYGLSDIRGSSTQRNAAIQSDLVDHLRMASDIITLAQQSKPLPFLDEVNNRISKTMSVIKAGVSSGDEMGLLDFLRKDVEPLFNHIQTFNDNVRQKIDAYKAALDPQFGFYYHQRKDFEESVMLINETISTYIDEEEIKAQAMFPHYFEKYKTDGVDYGVYIGKSLTETKDFDLLYLRNLRLWQIMLMCGIARKTKALKEKLKVPLDTAHLILVQDTPLSIRFRFDEKKFDVDGTYNIRYEIMKKRIDKAIIKGRQERLTQPGKIAIVYSQPREATEYKRYIDYLQTSGYLLDEIEQCDLEDLQGIQGLRALRVAVNLKDASDGNAISVQRVRKIVKSIEQFTN